MVLKKNIRYLQIALNSTLEEARMIIAQLPFSERILIEAGTPLIKVCGIEAIRNIKTWWIQRVFGLQMATRGWTQTKGTRMWWPQMLKGIQGASGFKGQTKFLPYVVADIKCADLGTREVRMAAQAGASAVTCLGVAPTETIDLFVEECKRLGLDAMIDMMNVEAPVMVLKTLKKLPDVVILHRGVDEEVFNPEKELPVHHIQAIKSSYDVLVSIAGGDTFDEVQRAVFNDADIVVVWKSFYKSTAQTAHLAQQFLKEIR